MTSIKNEQVQSQPQDFDDNTLDVFYSEFSNKLSEVLQERHYSSQKPTESGEPTTLGELIDVDLKMVIDEHKAKMNDLIAQKLDQNVDLISRLRA